MSLFNLSRSLIYISSTLGLLTISNLLLINPANAFGITFSNGGFDDNSGSLNDWTSTGDATFNTGIDSVNPLSSPSQAIVTTGYENGVNNRSDDAGLNFNQSGIDPIDADTLTTNNTGTGDLQSFLNLDTSAFSIARSDGLSGFRTPKEGSAIYQDIVVSISSADVSSVNNSFNLNFNWAYLSNDGKSPDLGNQDFSFVSIANAPNNTDDGFLNDPNFASGLVTTLGDSDQNIYNNGNIINPTGDNDFINQDVNNYTANNLETLAFTGLGEGTYRYRVGFGVVDVDNYDRSSALLVDNFNIEQVPFDFSPSAGLLAIAGIFGLKTLLEKKNNEVKE